MNEGGHRHHHDYMLSVEEARHRILSFFSVLDSEEKPILDALGQVMSEGVTSRINVPPLDNSAMDGYAVKARDTKGASNDNPAVLQIVGSVAAGELPKNEVTHGKAIRIMTGAPVPNGADAIVPFEDTDEIARRIAGKPLSEIAIKVDVDPGVHIRPAGQDVGKGEQILDKGTILRPAEIGVLASLGRSQVRVIRKPVVAILATGDELLDPSDEYNPSKIYDSNSYSVAAAVVRYGGIPKLLGIAKDNLESMNNKLQEGLDSDILITSAGVSKGDYDMVKDVLAQHGKIDFWSVRMRPAKPLAFGMLKASRAKEVPHLGLPGNPVSSLVAFEQFGRPAIQKMLGKTTYDKPTVRAILDEPIVNTDGRRVYARAIVTKRNGAYYARLTGHQSSNLLTSMVRANGLAICPAEVTKRDVGELVEVHMLDWPEEVF